MLYGHKKLGLETGELHTHTCEDCIFISHVFVRMVWKYSLCCDLLWKVKKKHNEKTLAYWRTYYSRSTNMISSINPTTDSLRDAQSKKDHMIGYNCQNMKDPRWRRSRLEFSYKFIAATVAQWFRAFAPQAEGWVFESKLRQTLVFKLHCQMLGNRCLCHRSSWMTVINGCPVSL